MKHLRTYHFSFYVGLAALLLGVVLKLAHIEFGFVLVLTGILLSALFLAMSLQEIWNSKQVGRPEKILWTFALIFLNTIAGILYFLFGRKRMLPR